MLYVQLVLSLIGHTALWVACINRLHAISINRKIIDLLTVLCGLALVFFPIALLLAAWTNWDNREALLHMPWIFIWAYAAICGVAGVYAVIQWFRRAWTVSSPGTLLSNHTSRIRAQERAALTAPGIPTWLSRLPGNQVLDICVHEKELVIPRMSPEQAGLRVAHLTDLHMSGRITRGYFEQVVDEVNRAEPDVVAITGDIIERAPCVDWIPATLGRLRAPGGVHYVLGNHDMRVDVKRLKGAMADAGLNYLGGRWQEVTVRGKPLILVGNELPWFGPAADLKSCQPRGENGCPLRLLLAHTPDQFGWAQANDIDLMLAGHNHGGQIRLPILGPIFSPSLHGVRYASGVFRGGKTVMHVSRGTCCLTPLRFNCPPEIAVLVLRQG